MNAAEAVAAHLRDIADFEMADEFDDLPHDHMGATITDAMLQAGLRYETVG